MDGVNMSIIKPAKSLFNDNSKEHTLFNRNDESGRETPKLLSYTKEAESKRDDGVIVYSPELKAKDLKDTPRSFQSKTSSLNRARIITNLDDLKDDYDDQVEYEKFKQQMENRNKDVEKRRLELENLLNDLDDQSEVALSRRISKIGNIADYGYTEVPESLKNSDTKPTFKPTSVCHFII